MLDPARPPISPTKAPRDENFPVASRFLARPIRGAVLAFYRFAREADDIADSRHLRPEAKLRQLEAYEAALRSGDPAIPAAARLHAVDQAHGAGLAEALELLKAFKQDAVQSRYEDWAALIDYCTRSANPVGRFLLRLHRQGGEADAPADALCTALQILNHLQDAPRDRDALDRIYVPTSWMALAGGESAFFEPGNAGRRRPILDAALDRVDALVDEARVLPARLTDRRLALQSCATLALAERLSARLRRRDPMAARVEVSKADIVRASLGALRSRSQPPEEIDRSVTRATVRRSGSSFRLGMSALSAERRRAIHAVYAFCRVVDDIADGAAPALEKQRFLTAWRAELDRMQRAPAHPVARELAWATSRFDLPVAEYHAMLDGMETDSADRVRLASDEDLDTYARRVAGSVGALSIRIFGAPEAQDFALQLGRTLQFVNILRDVDEDAGKDRVYLPLSRLAQAGLQDGPARLLVCDPRLAGVCDTLAEEAAAGFAAADTLLQQLDRRILKPAILMMEGYRRILVRLRQRGFAERGERLKLTRADRLQLLGLALRAA